MHWWSAAEAMKITIPQLVSTHTEGQLRLIALASHVQYENMKGEFKDKGTGTTNESDDYKPSYSGFDNDLPPSIPVSRMTKNQLDDYYRSREF